MGNSNVHNHKRCPLFLAGHAGGALKGGLHLRAADGTPMANVMLSVTHMLGMDDFKQFGDSTAAFDLNTVPATTAALSTTEPRRHGGTGTLFKCTLRIAALYSETFVSDGYAQIWPSGLVSRRRRHQRRRVAGRRCGRCAAIARR